MSNPLDDEINNDLIKIMGASPLLIEAWEGLPQADRDAVLNQWNGLQWKTILAAAVPSGQDGYPKEIPLQLGFTHDLNNHFGFVRLIKPMDKLHEYVISPIYNSYDGEIVTYALTHRTRVMSDKLLKQVTDAEAKHAPT